MLYSICCVCQYIMYQAAQYIQYMLAVSSADGDNKTSRESNVSPSPHSLHTDDVLSVCLFTVYVININVTLLLK